MFLPGIAAAFALILIACPAGTGGGEYNGLGKKLNISGRVYTRDIDTINYGVNYAEYKDNLSVSDGGIGGTGKIEKGRLSYSIGEPALIEVDEGLAMLQKMYDGVKFNPADARASVVNLTITDNPDYILLSREKIDIKQLSLDCEFVSFAYVDRDVTVTADGDSFRFDGFDIPMEITTEIINLKLKKGWNAVCGRITGEPKFSLVTGVELSGNLSISVGDPSSLKWTLSSSQELLF